MNSRVSQSRRLRADVIVVGGGNAGFSAALSAADHGRTVVLLEKGGPDDAGGNSYYTAGATRIVHAGLSDLLDVVEDDPRNASAEVPAYTPQEYTADLEKVTGGRNDPILTEVLVRESTDTVRWLVSHGLRYRLMYERQAYRADDGSHRFWGGLHIGNVDGGQGLIRDHTEAAARAGIDVRMSATVTSLIDVDGAVVGVRFVDQSGAVSDLYADSVILAAGGFEASPQMRETHLGPGWSKAKVRGTSNNTGELIQEALRVGAQPGGDWSTCHSVAWDALHEQNESNRELTNRLTRQSYPLGVVVNVEGNRFVDEGEDFRNYTYAKYGAEILKQPGSIAFQIFDAQTRPLLRGEEYDMPGVSVFTAESIEQLAAHAGIDEVQFRKTIEEYNGAISDTSQFDPTIKDGRSADVVPPKSNWAVRIDQSPFYAFPVTCGITFTFGGIATDTFGRALDAKNVPIKGLFVVGEMLGGLFSGNYPGGTGLTAGAVFGRRAGSLA